VPGAQPPSPEQGPYSHSRDDAQKRVRVPQLPHLTVSVTPGFSHRSTVHSDSGSNVHASLHRRSRCPVVHPSRERTSAPGLQTPSLVHEPIALHPHVSVQTSRCLPQLPHDVSRNSPGLHVPLSPWHGPYSQRLEEVQKRWVVPHFPHFTDSSAPGTSHGSGSRGGGVDGSSGRAVGTLASGSPASPSPKVEPSLLAPGSPLHAIAAAIEDDANTTTIIERMRMLSPTRRVNRIRARSRPARGRARRRSSFAPAERVAARRKPREEQRRPACER
jgi:hypothetical protein